MHVGKLKNEPFINSYKDYGFVTRTQLIDTACDELRKKLRKTKRAKWRRQAFKEYADSKADYAWENLDEEDFS